MPETHIRCELRDDDGDPTCCALSQPTTTLVLQEQPSHASRVTVGKSLGSIKRFGCQIILIILYVLERFCYYSGGAMKRPAKFDMPTAKSLVTL